MARSSSSAASSQRSKKPSLAEGVTPRPRRRKQPTTSTKGGRKQSNDNNDDGDYSFLAGDNDVSSMTDSSNKRSSGVKSGRDKENETNHQPDKSKPRDKIIAVQDDTRAANKKQHSNIDELNDAMAKVSLGGDNGNKSSRAKREASENSLQLSSAAVLDYTIGACPPVGYGTNKISVSTSSD